MSLSVQRQCALIGLAPSSYYYTETPTDPLTLTLLNTIDEEYTRHPFLGTRKMCYYLMQQGFSVNRKRVQRLYQCLGIEAIYSKPNLSRENAQHKKYPYLLKGLSITRPNQVYCSDITYIRLSKGFMYLVAIMDWYSRYVLGWRLSPTLEAEWCIDLLSCVLSKKHCEIFNSDQGVQFTSEGFTRILLEKNINISMDGRGRALDNVFIERLWRSVKYECIYLHEFSCVAELQSELRHYFYYYNYDRPHQHLQYQTPADYYYQGKVPRDALPIE